MLCFTLSLEISTIFACILTAIQGLVSSSLGIRILNDIISFEQNLAFLFIDFITPLTAALIKVAVVINYVWMVSAVFLFIGNKFGKPTLFQFWMILTTIVVLGGIAAYCFYIYQFVVILKSTECVGSFDVRKGLLKIFTDRILKLLQVFFSPFLLLSTIINIVLINKVSNRHLEVKLRPTNTTVAPIPANRNASTETRILVLPAQIQ
ncbi:uncharacterized protein LOC111088006 [Limulus polyphemus]|uniref:Uncharacterized protein LOC111088006 n=1 Tax=Limulus polyphemus TaxID=6850 RepID=A0ABM1T954_LIMPO|nr:uncharacterized protein LOC111088006 [Limulus polyphemus]XP_022252411.1 uncharacterized protein LOC111088006 [Limulus polyphemus]